MIETPLGDIQLYIDDVLCDYEYEPHLCTVRSISEKPLAGCYRIRVSAEEWQTIRCVAALNDPQIRNSGSSGERYLYSEFSKDRVVLTIGAGDGCSAFDTIRLPHGVEYVKKAPVDQVMFGVSWATDYEGPYDIRTQLATDLY